VCGDFFMSQWVKWVVYALAKVSLHHVCVFVCMRMCIRVCAFWLFAHVVAEKCPLRLSEHSSKRQTLNRKYRNEHLVKQHHKKLKKAARKAKELGIKPGESIS